MGILTAPPAAANGDRLYLDCPCEIESDGSTFSITAGVRSFLPADTGVLFLSAELRRSSVHVAEVFATDTLAGGTTLETATYDDTPGNQANTRGTEDIDLVLYELLNEGRIERDRVLMEAPVDLSGAFSVTDLDYLKDADGDGVGDVNERSEGTDPSDPESTPGDSTIDVLAIYSQGVPGLFDGDPTTRIQHLFALANDRYANSSAGLRFRLVGLVEAHVDESEERIDLARQSWPLETERHGADLVVLFRPRTPTSPCGTAEFIGGLDSRGHFDFEHERSNFATVYANCGAHTLAHELGHVLGLAHSFWQGEYGTWRWSRGHAVDDDFGTVMTYGPQHGRWNRINVFSSPRNTCVGVQEVEKACGVDGEEVNGADAVTTLNAVRFQIAAFRESLSDADEDGFVDAVDAFPDDSGDWWDADADGLGDNADTDDDNDGVLDDDDAFPFDDSESADTDGDGVGDNADALPLDPGETSDADGDGVGDNADVFPDDPLESADTDGDGVGDNADPWPENPAESVDTDGDGVGNNADRDDDDDSFADHLDAFPLDAAKWDLASYLFIGEAPGDQAGEILSRAGDGDAASFLIGVPQHDGGGRDNAGAAYLVSALDLATLDAADGVADRVIGLGRVATGANSWKFVGENAGDGAGRSLVSTGDMDGDGETDVLIGAPHSTTQTGAVYFISGADFSSADTADGAADRTIHLGHVASQASSWKFVGESNYDEAGIGVASVPDTDGDAKAELLIGAWGHDPGERSMAGATYFLASSDFSAADAADGAQDGVIDLGYTTGQPASWKLIGESSDDRTGSPLSAPGDIDGDGHVEIAINSLYRAVARGDTHGAVYLVSTHELAAADSADGEADHVVDLSRIAGLPKSWKLHNGRGGSWARRPISIANDGVGPTTWLTLTKRVLSGAELASTDVADGREDGVVDLDLLSGPPTSWRLDAGAVMLVGDTDGDGGDNLLATDPAYTSKRKAYLFPLSMLAEIDAAIVTDGDVANSELNVVGGVHRIYWPTPFAHPGATSAGDVDGDGVSDILLGDPGPAVANRPGAVYLILGADLTALDRVDRLTDGRLFLGNVAGDADGDDIANTFDRDDDGDGIPDSVDAFQLDPGEWADSDRDGVGDNADAFPDDRLEQVDTDGDGLGDFRADNDDDGDGILDNEDALPLDTDNDGSENRDDVDDDGDGVPDIDDALPIDPNESVDTDGDGTGNNADTDDDNDGVSDDEDTFPLDAGETADTDTDGVGDNSDAFPFNANETGDNDSDGVGDNTDTDDDNDGVLDGDDAFPLDADNSTDTDGDGVADSRDAFPNDAGESEDADGDGVGDNADTDDDNDGVDDMSDLFPTDVSRHDLMSVRLVLGEAGQRFIPGVATAGDLDGDDRPEVLVRSPDSEGDAVVLVVSPDDLESADDADGVRDGSINARHIPSQYASWQLVGEEDFVDGRHLSSLGDLGDDGVAEFFVGADAYVPKGYIASGADLLGADALHEPTDGVVGMNWFASQPSSWEVSGRSGGASLRTTVPVDLNGDGVVELAFGQPGAGRGDSPGTVQVYSASALPMLDALPFGFVDGGVPLTNENELWRLVGEAPRDQLGTTLAITDFDGDGRSDLVVGAPQHKATFSPNGAVYLLSNDDLTSADLADGLQDAQIELGRIAAEPNSWKLVGEAAFSQLGDLLATGDVDGDGQPELILSNRDSQFQARITVVFGNTGNLEALDRANGDEDGVIALSGNRRGENIMVPAPYVPALSSLDAVDFDGDGREDLVVGFAIDSSAKVAHLISASFLLDDFRESTNEHLDFDERLHRAGSYQIYAPEAEVAAENVAVSAAGDFDADGLGDFLLSVIPHPPSGPAIPRGAAYLIVAADLPLLDAADGRRDGRIFLSYIGRRLAESPGRSPDETDSSVASSDGSCFVGLLVRPGESCTYPGTDDEFTVNVRGRGRFLDSLAGIRIRIDNETIDGRVYDFEASHQGDGLWRIDRVAGSTEPPSSGDGDGTSEVPTEPPSAEDSDGDGIPNDTDPDDDNDGTIDLDDPCPLDSSDSCDDASSVASLDVSGATPLTAIGETIQLTATVHMLDGSSQAIASAFVHWVSADPSVVTVIDGTVTAVGPGNAQIVATYQGQKAVTEVSVHISLHETKTVRVIYAAPTDREFRSDYRDAIQHAIVDLQSWYRRQLGGLTFSLYDATPEQCQLGESSDYYDQDTWQKVLEGLQHCAPVKGHTSTFAWVVYADLESLCGQRAPLGRGGPGLAMLPRGDMEGLTGDRLVDYGACGEGPWPGPVTRWIGGLGHELGHALELSHPAECDAGLSTCDFDALMHLGYTKYPNAHLRADDKRVLWRSPFIDKSSAQRQLLEDAENVTAIRGTVSDSNGNIVEGIRIAAASDAFWAWGETTSDGSYEIRLQDGFSGSAILSSHAGDVASCGWLGYHVAGGLTTIREHATRVEVGAVDPNDVDITLPIAAGELCQGQRTISGIVRGPDGNPEAAWAGAFNQWSWTGEDGLFQIRLPESREGLGSTSPLLVHALECGLIGYYGPGSFTTRLADAWRVEYGGVDVAGIEIRLPATPEELCGQ